MRATPRLLLLLAMGCSSAPGGGDPPLKARWECDSKTDRERWLPEGSPDGDEYKRGNLFGVVVWWEGPPGLRESLVVATLQPSRNPGACLNSGSDTLPDFYFEKELNPAWQFDADDTGKIPGVQALRVTCRLPAADRAGLVVSSFDWGGNFRLNVAALPEH